MMYCEHLTCLSEILLFRSSKAGIITFAIIDVLFSRVINLWYVNSTFTATTLIALIDDFALFASTSAFIPLIRVPPTAAPACNIAIIGIALFPLSAKCNCPLMPEVVNGPFEVRMVLLGKRPGRI